MKNAIHIRKEISLWMLNDFGYKKNPRSITSTIHNISEEDEEILNSIFEKYGRNRNKAFISQFPEWFVTKERSLFMELMRDMIHNIVTANSIHPRTELEANQRRLCQDKAISDCYDLFNELYYAVSIFYSDIDKMKPILDSVNREIELLKGWRQSDNKHGGSF